MTLPVPIVECDAARSLRFSGSVRLAQDRAVQVLAVPDPVVATTPGSATAVEESAEALMEWEGQALEDQAVGTRALEAQVLKVLVG